MSVTASQFAAISAAQTDRMMGKTTRSKSVPKTMQARYDQIVALTDAFCRTT